MSEIEKQVCAKIQHRAKIGAKTYGKTMERDDLDRIAWLCHAQEEAMDLAIYLQRLINDEITACAADKD